MWRQHPLVLVRRKATAAKAKGFQGRSAFKVDQRSRNVEAWRNRFETIPVATSSYSTTETDPSNANSPEVQVTAPVVEVQLSAPEPTQVSFHAAGRIRRALVPSFSDCFFMALVGWLFIFGASGWKALLGDGDTGWHIRTGQYILAHHAVPTQDLFSFSRAGAPWFAWEWLTDVMYAALFQMGGLKAIVLAAGLMIGIFSTVVLRYTLWRGANPLVALFSTLLAAGASSMHFLARPHLFTLLLVPVGFWVLEADRRKNTCWLWALIPVTVLWTNLHGGFVIFLACIALLVAGSALEAWLGAPRWPAVRRYGLLLVACSLASLINPYGVQLHVHIFEYLRADWIKNIVQEFQAPTFRNEGQLQYEALLLAGLIAIGFLLRKRRFIEALWILFLAHASLISVRHAPIYATIAAPLIACELSEWWSAGAARMKKSAAVRILHDLGTDLSRGFRRTSCWPAVFALVLVVLDAPLKWPRDFPGELFPTTMIHKHAGLVAHSRLLTTDQWGDYIIYSFYPDQKVYVDGRSDFYGETFANQYLHLLQGAYDWRAIVERNRFDVALLPADWPLSSLLKQDPSWQVVDDDHRSVLLRRLSRQAYGK